MFASRITKQIDVADDNGGIVVVTVRKLSARSLEKAAEAKQIALMQNATAVGRDAIRMFRDDAADAPKKEAPAPKTPPEAYKAKTDAYDRESVLVAGIVSWTAPESVADSIADLDEATSQLLFDGIMELSIPGADSIPKA